MTIAAALDAFADSWVAAQHVTPRSAYGRTLRLLRFHLERSGVDTDGPLDALTADHLRDFVAWHATSGMVDDADQSRRAALHIARLAEHLADAHGRDDLRLDRAALRALVR